MSKIITFLNEDLIRNLKELCRNSGKSLSKVTSELVEVGYQAKQNQNEDAQKAKSQDKLNMDFALKDREYLLRILNIDAEILRKIYNEPSKCLVKTANAKLATIKFQAQKLVETKLNKAQ
jgi:hypothetical protein